MSPRRDGTDEPIDSLGTDPLGREVIQTDSTRAHAELRHAEMRRTPEHTRAAVEAPALIADHHENPARLVYVGEDREPPDIALAPTRRVLIVETTGDTSGTLITGWDETSSFLRVKTGTVRYRAPDE